MNIVGYLQKIGIALVGVLPERALDWLATGIGSACCTVLTTKRAYIETNIQHIFYDMPLTVQEQRSLVKRTFVLFARAMVDFFRLGSITCKRFDVECRGFGNLARALNDKHGCILVTAHIGNWDYAGAYLAALGIPMSALVEVTEPEMFELYTRHREHTGMRTFPLERAGHAFLHAIKSNRVLAVLADRDIMGSGIVVDFFDGKRKIPRGLGEIVIKKQIPVIFAYMVFHPDPCKHRYLGVIEEPKVFTGNVEDFHGWLVKKLEYLLRRYPDQWFVFHPEWIEQGVST
jgi:lauroyl/myristoyl acyltransferase